MSKVIHIMSGAAGSGKTTYINSHLTSSAVALHRDELREKIRAALHSDHTFPLPAEEEFTKWVESSAALIKDNPEATDYWFDATFLKDTTISFWYRCLVSIFPEVTDYDIIVEILNTPVNQCIANNANRTGFAFVPENIIRQMSEAHKITTNLRRCLKSLPTERRLTLHYINTNERIDL